MGLTYEGVHRQPLPAGWERLSGSEQRVVLDLGDGVVGFPYRTHHYTEGDGEVTVRVVLARSDAPEGVAGEGVLRFPPMGSFLVRPSEGAYVFHDSHLQPWKCMALSGGRCLLLMGGHSAMGMMMTVVRRDGVSISGGPVIPVVEQGALPGPRGERWVGYNEVGDPDGPEDRKAMLNGLELLRVDASTFYLVGWDYRARVAYRQYSISSGDVITPLTAWRVAEVEGRSEEQAGASDFDYVIGAGALVGRKTVAIVAADKSEPGGGRGENRFLAVIKLDLESGKARYALCGEEGKEIIQGPSAGSTPLVPLGAGSVQTITNLGEYYLPQQVVTFNLGTMKASRVVPLAQLAPPPRDMGLPEFPFGAGGGYVSQASALQYKLPGPIWSWGGNVGEKGVGEINTRPPVGLEAIVGMVGGPWGMSSGHPFRDPPEGWTDIYAGIGSILVTRTHIIVWRHFLSGDDYDGQFIFFRYRANSDLSDGAHRHQGHFS